MSILGVGDHLYVFDKENCRLLQKIKIFHGHKIYGIVPNLTNKTCLLFSGIHLKIIEFSDAFTKINNLVEKTFSDWILDAQWINRETFATVSMHNRLQIWDLLLQLKIEKECEDKCILYSAHIYLEDEILMIFSGTVFSEILVWNGKGTNQRCLVLKRLKGHKVSCLSFFVYFTSFSLTYLSAYLVKVVPNLFINCYSYY